MKDLWDRRMRLNVIEELLFWDDRPAYPWSFYVKLHFAGVIDRAAFERAVEVVSRRHVLLCSLVQIRGKRLYFVPQRDALPQIDWRDESPGEQLPSTTHLDITKEIGLRIIVRQNETEADVTLQIQHSACDGLGTFEFADELMMQYANELDSSAIFELPQLDPSLILKRGKWGVNWRNWFKTMRNQLIGLKGAKQFLQRHPVSLIPCVPEADTAGFPENYPHTLQYRLDREQTAMLVKAAKRAGCTVNDWLTQKIFLAVSDWRNTHPDVDENDWIRMMVPVSLRGRHSIGSPAANIVSSIFLDRRGEHFENPEELLLGIHDEMQLIKRRNLGLVFPFSLKLTRWAPGGLKKAARQDKCSMSLIFTNPGRVFVESKLPQDDQGQLQAGNLTLIRPELVSPLRPYNLMTFSSVCYAGQIGIAVNVDRRVTTKSSFDPVLKTILNDADNIAKVTNANVKIQENQNF